MTKEKHVTRILEVGRVGMSHRARKQCFVEVRDSAAFGILYHDVFPEHVDEQTLGIRVRHHYRRRSNSRRFFYRNHRHLLFVIFRRFRYEINRVEHAIGQHKHKKKNCKKRHPVSEDTIEKTFPPCLWCWKHIVLVWAHGTSKYASCQPN